MGRGGGATNVKGGLIGTHFSSKCILPDGLWLEGAPAYQLGIVSGALFNVAETKWHHGMDLYSFNNAGLKRLLDSPIGLAYPNQKMRIPALHDSGVCSLLDDREWFSTELAVPYELGYRRYLDKRYLTVIRNSHRSLSMTIHCGPPSPFVELPPVTDAPKRKIENANYFNAGYGVLRIDTPDGGNQLIMEYGPSAGHAYPSKLGIDLYVLGEALMPFPGVIFPHDAPLDAKWYWTTLGNCAMTVDEKSQIYSGDRWKFPKGTQPPEATQIIYSPGAHVGIQRAWSNSLYIGVTQDRSLFLTSHCLADIFAAFGDEPHTYDLAWHFRGKMATSLKMDM